MSPEPRYNPLFNGMSCPDFSSSSSITKFYALSERLGERGNFSSGSLRVVLLDSCNERCFFCYNEGVPIQGHKIEPLDLELILEAIGSDINTIKLVGGEPLLHPRFEDLVDIAKRVAPTTVTTNGLLIKRHIDSLRKLDEVTVSLHSVDPEHYGKFTGVHGRAVYTVLEGIRALKDSGYQRLKLNMVLSRRTMDHVSGVLDFAIENEIQSLSILSLLTMNDSDRSEFVSPSIVEQFLEERGLRSLTATTTRNRYFGSEKTAVDVVWQYCNVGCNVCRQDGFIRLTPNYEFAYCLTDSSVVNFREQVEKRDKEGIREKFLASIQSMGKPK